MNRDVFRDFDITTPEFTLNDQCMYARLVDIIDGDSLIAILPVLGSFYKYHIRINGIDTCEIKSKNDQNKQLALRARSEIFTLVTNNNSKTKDINNKSITRQDIRQVLQDDIYIIYIECKDFDKYGRLLAEVYTDDTKKICFSKHLVDNHLAYPYTGETKLTELEQLDVLQ